MTDVDDKLAKDKIEERYEFAKKAIDRMGSSVLAYSLERVFLIFISNLFSGISVSILWNKVGAKWIRTASSLSEDDYKKICPVLDKLRGSFENIVIEDKDKLRFVKKNFLMESQDASSIGILEGVYGSKYEPKFITIFPLEDTDVNKNKYCLEIYHNEPICFDNNKENIFNLAKILQEKYNNLSLIVNSIKHSHINNFSYTKNISKFIYKDLKTGFGEDFKSLNIFRYDPNDHFLYHLDTSELELDKKLFERFKPTKEFNDEHVIKTIKYNIKNSDTNHSNEELIRAYNVLSSDINDDVIKLPDDLLKELLMLMPQEPGTGVAGDTAITFLPKLADANDPRWNNSNYPGRLFSVMLAIEKLFGIGSLDNSMIASPLFESGQLWGVVFVVGNRDFKEEQVTDLWINAQNLSLPLSIYRTLRFHQRITKEIRDDPSPNLAKILLKNINYAINSILAINFCLDENKKVEWWGIEKGGVYKKLGEGNKNDSLFNQSGIWENVKRFLEKSVVFTTVSLDNPFLVCLPKSDKRKNLGISDNIEKLKTAISIPLPYDNLVIVFVEQDKFILKSYQSTYLERFSIIWDVYKIQNKKEIVESEIFFPKMRSVIKQLKSIGEMDEIGIPTNILLRGETGVGKTYFAKKYFEYSIRSIYQTSHLFGVSSDWEIDERLFGYVAGYQDTKRSLKIGDFDRADKGVIFLDEIGNLSTDTQNKMLVALRDGEITRRGADHPHNVDVTVIAATNKKLEMLIETGKFQQDLLNRFHYKISIPSLNDRDEEIPDLLRILLQKRIGNRLKKIINIDINLVSVILNIDYEDHNINALESLVVSSVASISENIHTNNSMFLLDYLSEEVNEYVNEDVKKILNKKKKKLRYKVIDIAKIIYCDKKCNALASIDDVYDVEDDDDWVFHLSETFLRIKDKLNVGKFCTIGSGIGIEAISAINNFDLNTIHVTDISPMASFIAKENAIYHAAKHGIEIKVTRTAGDLFFGMNTDNKFDLIYENLPNIPVDKKVDGKWTGTYYKLKPESSNDSWLIQSHLNFLEQAKYYLEPDGCVLCSIGARIPWQVVKEMFENNDYTAELVEQNVVIKRQQQAKEVVNGYAEFETNETKFSFLDMDSFKAKINSTNRIGIDEYNDILKDKSITMTATEAQSKLDTETIIGHGVFYVLGRYNGTYQ